MPSTSDDVERTDQRPRRGPRQARRRRRAHERARAQQVADAGRRLPRHVHAAARRHDRERRAARHPDLAEGVLLRPAVGRRRLRADAGRAAADRRLARRHVRPQVALLASGWSSSPSPRCSAASPPITCSSSCPGAPRASAAPSCSRSRWRCWPTRSAARTAASPSASGVAITGVAVAIGPLLGGALTSGLSWRWIFFVNLPIGIARAGHDGCCGCTSPSRRTPAAPTGSASSPSRWRLAVADLRAHRVERARLLVRPGRRLLHRGGACCWSRSCSPSGSGKHPMFDLGLFRLPTFTGGLVAAFGISASIFSMFLYLVALPAGHAAVLPVRHRHCGCSSSPAASWSPRRSSGRLSEHVPVRWLIGPGLLSSASGCCSCAGLNAGSHWTHLIPGFIVVGIGVGLINPPLASTAVGVVEPQRAGMASGINSTFRQVGIATGIALLGTLFSTRTHDRDRRPAGARPGRAPVRRQDRRGPAFGRDRAASSPRLPANLRGPVGVAARGAFTAGLNLILLVAAVIALVCGVISLLPIRTKDFVSHESRPPAARLTPTDPAASGRLPGTSVRRFPYAEAVADPATYRPAPGSIPEAPGRLPVPRRAPAGSSTSARPRACAAGSSSYFQDIVNLHPRTQTMVAHRRVGRLDRRSPPRSRRCSSSTTGSRSSTRGSTSATATTRATPASPSRSTRSTRGCR